MAVWSWGSDVYGRLGHGTEDHHIGTPTEIKALSQEISGLTSATVGSAQNAIALTNGQCYTWEKCHYGQLGHGEMDQNELIPRPVQALSGVKIQSLGSGDSHVLAITDQGQLYTWGVGFYGALGHGDETTQTVPKLVEKLLRERISSATGGAFHSLALNAKGRLFVWGRNNMGQLGLKGVEMPDYAKGGKSTKTVYLNQKIPVQLDLPQPANMISARNDHSLVLLEDGTIATFGANTHGQLGRDKMDKESAEHFLIDPEHFKNPTTGKKEPVSFISAGYDHCAAITESGVLYTWGENKHGQLGLGHMRQTKYPTLVKQFPGSEKAPKFSEISCGDSFTIALSEDAQLWSFGSCDYGKLGVTGGGAYLTQPNRLPDVFSERLSGSKVIGGIRCGTNHSLAFTTDSGQ